MFILLISFSFAWRHWRESCLVYIKPLGKPVVHLSFHTLYMSSSSLRPRSNLLHFYLSSQSYHMLSTSKSTSVTWSKIKYGTSSRGQYTQIPSWESTTQGTEGTESFPVNSLRRSSGSPRSFRQRLAMLSVAGSIRKLNQTFQSTTYTSLKRQTHPYCRRKGSLISQLLWANTSSPCNTILLR